MRMDNQTIQALPRPLVRGLRNLYLAMLDLSDRVRGRTDDLTPPRALHFVGNGDFRLIGKTFLRHFVDVCQLRADERILDIGCGTGRMAIPLLDFLTAPGAYVGFDISEKAIRWCQDHITARNPRFTFCFADIRNDEYNPKGRVAAAGYRFPCEAETIDFVFATSVFTHMRLPEVRRYLSEIRRVLSPGGRAFLNFFILDGTNQALVREGKASIRFSVALEDGYTMDPHTPERAIAYTEDAIRGAFADAGLTIRPPIRYGSWSGRASMLDTQDIVIATRP